MKFKMLEKMEGPPVPRVTASPLTPADRKEEAAGGRIERAWGGLLGQLNQRNYFPTDEAKNSLMTFS